MVRHVTTVLVSALLGSLLGTLLLVVSEGGTGTPNPAGFIFGFTADTMMFTFPGAVLLMATTFLLAERRASQLQAAVLLVLSGALAGAAMLALIFFSIQFALWGAMFGLTTATAFTCILWALRGYPQPRG